MARCVERGAVCGSATGLALALSLSMALAPLGAWAQDKAHQHGMLTLGIAIEARGLSVQMASPLDNLVGFERAPRTDAERGRVEATLAKLQAGAAMFAVDPAAQCRLARVELVSAALALGTPTRPAGQREHADLEASYAFDCQDAARAAFVDVGLFDAFAGVRQIEVQVAAPAGQFKRTLKRPARRVLLTR